MNATKIFDIARRITWEQWSSYFTDALLLDYANITYHELENILSPLDTWLFMWERTLNTTAWTNVYSIPRTTSTATVTWVKKIQAVEVNINDAWIRLWERKLDNQMLADATSRTEQFYTIKGNSIQFYGITFSNTDDAIKIIWVADLLELWATTVEANISIPYQYHYVISLWIAYYIFIEQRKFQEAQNHYQFYLQKRDEMRSNILANRRHTEFQDLAPTTIEYAS